MDIDKISKRKKVNVVDSVARWWEAYRWLKNGVEFENDGLNCENGVDCGCGWVGKGFR